MASHRKRKRDDGNEIPEKGKLLPPVGLPQLDDIGSFFRTEFLNFGGGDPDLDGYKPEPIEPTLGFHAMGGAEHLIDEVRNRILFPVLNADFVNRHDRYPPKGILLHGPPGTGKTLFAKCLAAELSNLGTGKFTFFMRRGSDMMSCWVGSSERNIRQIFAKAVQSKPSILFFDEADSLAPNRENLQSTVPVYTNVVTAILSEMDKINRGEVIVIFATNRIDAIDPAIKRPGRCDVILPFYSPDVEGRKRIIEIYTKNWALSSPNQRLLNILAIGTKGFTGADLDKLCSEAFFACVRRTQKNANFTVTKVSESEHVTEDDWKEALYSMKPSRSNVFGSYLQVLGMSDFIQPLVRTSTRNLANVIETKFLRGNTKISNTGGPNCFLVWNTSPRSEDILDLLVVPTVLGSLNRHALYVLNEESMLQEHKQFSINSILTIINQAKTSTQPAILFIPRIDKLANRLSGECTLLRKLLFDTANNTVLVLATASTDIGGLPYELRSVFDGYSRAYKLEKPNEKEREEFYKPVFKDFPKNEEFLNEVISLTDHDDMWSMVTLHRELTWAGNTKAELKTIIESYRKCRLCGGSK